MYQTFMNAYTLVDSQTRRKLDEMLKTWKEPVPGSLDTRPVFPSDVTRNIESALIKARTAALQQQQARGQPEILNRGRGSVTPTGWTNNHTAQPGTPRPPNQHQVNNGQGYGTSVRKLSILLTMVQADSFVFQTPPPGHRPDVDLDTLNRDLEALVASARNDFANSPFNSLSQQRLKALLDLQSILQRQQLTQDQLKLVRDQVSALAVSSSASAANNSTPNVPTPAPAAAPPAPVSTPPTQSISQPLQQLLNPGTLAELIKATAGRQQPTPPQIPNALPPMPQIPPTSNTPQPAAENPLIAALRSRGLLPPASAPPSLASGTPPNGGALPFILPGQARATPPAPTPQVSIPTSSVVPMDTASMKM